MRRQLVFHIIKTVRELLRGFWVLSDADGSGSIDRDEYLDLHLHLYAAATGAGPPTRLRRKLRSRFQPLSTIAPFFSKVEWGRTEPAVLYECLSSPGDERRADARRGRARGGPPG